MSTFGNIAANHVMTPTDVAANPGGLALFGDGSDGTVTISADTTLARDMFYDTLTVNVGVTLTCPFRVFVKNTLTVNGTMGNKGTNATGGAQAPDPTSGSLIIGSPPGGGGTNAAGSPTTTRAVVAGLQGIGGAGGASGAGQAGGAVVYTTVSANAANMRSLPWAITGDYRLATAIDMFRGGISGSGGGGAASSTGGGGGYGGGICVIVARLIVNNGAMTANGGNGGNASGTNAGGGGGGGGGVLSCIYNSLTNSGTMTAAGGTGGTKVGSGTAGADGGAGSVIHLANA